MAAGDRSRLGGTCRRRVGRKSWDQAIRPLGGISELAYWAKPAARGANTAARAVTALTRWAFDVLGLHRLELLHATDNNPSCRVAIKAAFHAEGTMRRQGLHRDGWHHMHLHARLAD
jgi:RimJ/RimL family protein N-acetyltransferase